ncbi:MAG: hypothetical protein IJY89_02370 [Clostridia bacterium]|nr:hypothetical protein [Clostridia bacterium]
MKAAQKKVLSFVLAVLLLLACVPVFGVPAAVVSDAATLPAAVDLRTTKHLPPIGNQGAIGCCASMAITYLQFTNAYSRYINSVNPNSGFNPSSGSNQYIFSPRFTYNLAGAGTAWVYEVLKEHGTVLQTYSNFQYDSYGGAIDNAMASDWATIDGYWREAQNYRIKNYDQVWIGSDPYLYKMTTSEAGLALIERIKSAVNDGNVVVTGGYPSRWKYASISSSGTYGKSGEVAICYSTGTNAGGHQVAIVGYDDNITCSVNGVTLKGAFLVANSWGTGWQNKGYTWMMYDSLNEVSPYSALNVSDRTWTMDQMCFLDWRTDLDIGAPDLVASVNVTTKNRSALTVKLTATGLDGSYLEHQPYMYDIEWAHPYSDINFYGGTSSATGTLSFNYDKLIAKIPAGKTINDYRFGVIVSSDSGYSATVNSVKLHNASGALLYSDNTVTTVSSGSSTQRELSNVKILLSDLPEGVTINVLSGSTFTTSSETVTFSLNVPTGYTAANAQVKIGNKVIYPVNGVYTASYNADTTLTVTGVVPTSKSININHYGFEYWGGDDACVYIVSIGKSDVSSASYSRDALAKGSYRYSFRVTVDGVIYEFVPSSFYEFEYSVLYRLPIANQGWIPAKGTYKLKIELCYDGIPIAVDSSVSATNSVDIYSTNSMKSHTHSYTGSTFAVTQSTCSHSGSGYQFCSTANCRAVKAVTLATVADAHHYEGEPTVTQNASSSAAGVKELPCTHCEAALKISFTAPACDTNGDDKVTVADVALMLDFLAGLVDETAIACDADTNEDQFYTIADVVQILYILHKS